MATVAGTITVPILARIDGKDIHIGDLSLPVTLANGKMKAPWPREIVAELRKARF